MQRRPGAIARAFGDGSGLFRSHTSGGRPQSRCGKSRILRHETLIILGQCSNLIGEQLIAFLLRRELFLKAIRKLVAARQRSTASTAQGYPTRRRPSEPARPTSTLLMDPPGPPAGRPSRRGWAAHADARSAAPLLRQPIPAPRLCPRAAVRRAKTRNPRSWRWPGSATARRAPARFTRG